MVATTDVCVYPSESRSAPSSTLCPSPTLARLCPCWTPWLGWGITPFTIILCRVFVQRFHALPRIHFPSFAEARRSSPRTDCVHAAAERVHYYVNVNCICSTNTIYHIGVVVFTAGLELGAMACAANAQASRNTVARIPLPRKAQPPGAVLKPGRAIQCCVACLRSNPKWLAPRSFPVGLFRPRRN